MIEIFIKRTIDEKWNPDKVILELSDEEILEDIFNNFENFLQGAQWTVVRKEESKLIV